MNSSFQRFQCQSWLIGSLALLIGLGWSKAVHAEGSADLIKNGLGDRPFLEYRNGFFLNTPIPRRTVINVYVNEGAGEKLNLGSSANGIGAGVNVGKINYRGPGGVSGTCPTTGTTGRIQNRDQEVNRTFTPCEVDPSTLAGNNTGIWQIEFVSPNPNSTTDPRPTSVNQSWTQDNNVSWIAAWDVAVRNSGGTPIAGRAYANYLPLNLGGNQRALNSLTFIQTREGFLYRIDLNGLDPFGFIFFANNKGFRDGSGNPLYRSVPLTSSINIHSPADPDTNTETTHKIFFNPPDLTLPESATIAGGGNTWLRNPPLSPLPTVRDLEFRGVDGTPNQAGPTVPGGSTLGGNFIFESSSVGNYVIAIDVNRDGIFGNANDRVLTGRTEVGKNTIFWDGKDRNGNPLTAGVTPYQSKLSFFTGDVHFPFFDPENNPKGLIIQRVNPTNTNVVENSTVYYDDFGLRSIGNPTDPISALAGIDSSPGVHDFGNGTQSGFGNENGIDTWTSLANPITLLGDILIQKADLSLRKTDSPDPVVAGASISYGLAVTSNQPPSGDAYSNIKGARVTDTVPPEITGVSWTCAITSGIGACGTASGTGNNIDLTLDLDVGAIATITVNGTVSPLAPDKLNNTATVVRPPDVTDPNPNNNTSSTDTTVTVTPPPVANKSVRFLRDNDGSGNLTIGDDIEYKIIVRNPNAVAIPNVVISDAIPIQWQVLRDASNPITVDSGFSLASTLPSSGFESTGSSVAFTEPGTLAAGATVTLTFNVRIRPGSASPLVNQGTINYQGDNGNPVLTDASDSTNPTAPGSGVNPGNPNPLNPDGSGGNVNQPNAGNADPTIINIVSPVTPTGTKSVRLFTDADGSGSVSSGDTLEYTITYSNPTASDINNFLVTDSIDSNGLSFVSGSYSLSASGTGTTVAANPNYNGTTDINLNRPGTLGRGGGQVVIKYRAVVRAAAGTEIRNQARATSIGGSVNPSVTDALQGPGDLPQRLDDGINQGNIPGNTGDDDPTVVRVGGSGTGPFRPVANKSVRFLRDNDGTGNLTIGDDIEYKIIVQNRNPRAITNLTVSDAIPFQWQVLRDASNPITVDSGFSLASPPALPSSSFVSTGNSVTFTNPGTLAPGATMTLTFNVRIRPGSPSPLINQGTINFQGDNGNPVLTDASDSTNPTGPGSDVNPGNPSPLNPDGSGGNVNQPNAGNADPTIIKFVSPITPTGTKSVRLVTDADGSGAVTTGDTLEYTITYSNTSSSDVTDFLATDSIDSNGLRFVSGSYSLRASGTGTTVAANPNYNGTTDTNLNTPGTLGRGGGQVVIKYRAVVLAAAGSKINNQARATSIGGNVSQSLTDALQGPGDLPQVLDDGINQGNLSDTGDDEPTGVTVGDVGNPRLRLVKRITSVTRGGVPVSGINFSTFVDDPADDNDNAPGWSQLSPVGVFRLGSEVSLQSGDEVEYTIYFLSDGAQNSRNIKFCDLIPAGTTFIPDSLGPGIGIRLRQGGTQSDQTNASDTDQGIFYSPLTPVTAPCSDPKNPNGAVFLQLGNIPNAAPNNGGFVRFRVRID
jgi:fimbrial isopeptide formation D2 family protein/uncharacterized repeat protein (TIGR01451 family)